MLIVNQIKMKPGFTGNELKNKISSELKISAEEILDIQIDKKSLDARKRDNLFFVLSVIVTLKNEDKFLKRNRNKNVSVYKNIKYNFKPTGEVKLNHRPVIIGAGPAGLFCAYFLALNGYKPLVLERGFDVDKRTLDVEKFFETGVLNKSSNVLFGEGGAGTFSDGKLNTLVKDKDGRNKEVLRLFVKFGADESILYEAKPHVGTDVLKEVIKNMRKEIEGFGGEFRFGACVTDFEIKDNKVKSITVNETEKIECDVCVLAIGHSARDTFRVLYDRNFLLEQKDFAVGFRIEHPQSLIDRELLTDDEKILKHLSPAAYKLTYKAQNDRGVYSFCMCPGGYVVNASSEDNRICVNGMSYSKRDGVNANSAIVVSVNSGDFGSDHPLAGIEFQRRIEENAYNAGKGNIPIQYYGEFKANVLGKDFCVDESKVITNPATKGKVSFADISNVLPKELSNTLIEGIDYFDRIISGFSDDYAILSAVESRTSCPVRITRDDDFESINIKGIYPSGEGAGYAGGITSAAMDGIKVFEHIALRYKSFA